MNGLSAGFASIAILISSFTVNASDITTISGLDQLSIQEIQKQLSRDADNYVRQEFPGHPIRAVRSVSLNRETNVVTVDLSPSVIASSPGPGELEEPLHRLAVLVTELLTDTVNIKWVEIKIDGKSLYDNYPNIFKGTPTTKNSASQVIINPGHGLYLNGTSWIFQRGESFGVQEDTLTPILSTQLANLIAARSLEQTVFTRSLSTLTHPDSGSPWVDMGAKYYLELVVPGVPSIWNTGSTELNKDLNSRPFFAGHIGGSALINIHTDAFTSPVPRGTRVYVNPGSQVSHDLAESVLCYMGEIINAQPGYEEFPVSSAPMAGNQIEVMHTGLTFPSIIVETAFHTNPTDAIALLDPVFQSAAMKGVEKGYRLHRQNEDCTPYEITDVPDVSAPWGSSVLVSISFQGFPQYPVELEVVDAECSTICTPGGGTLPSEWPSPIQLNMNCDGDPDSPPARDHLNNTP